MCIRDRAETGTESEGRPEVVEYRYALWDATLGAARLVRRTFEEEEAHFSWNYIDNVMAGEHFSDMLSPSFKYRRRCYVLPPPPSTSNATTEKAEALVAWIVSRARETSAAVSSELFVEPLVEPTVRAGSVPPGSIAVVGTLTYEVALEANGLRPREWVYVRVDDAIVPGQCFHVELHWMVASARNVQAVAEELTEKFAMVQVAEFCRSSHDPPAVAHPFIVPWRVVPSDAVLASGVVSGSGSAVASGISTAMGAHGTGPVSPPQRAAVSRLLSDATLSHVPDSMLRNVALLTRVGGDVYVRVDEAGNVDVVPNPRALSSSAGASVPASVSMSSFVSSVQHALAR